MSYIIYHISHIIYHISYIIYHISYIIYHISCIIYHVSYHIICRIPLRISFLHSGILIAQVQVEPDLIEPELASSGATSPQSPKSPHPGGRRCFGRCHGFL